MSTELVNSTESTKKKKPIFKRWWFWCLCALALVLIIGVLSSGGDSTQPDLASMASLSKQQIVEKFGKPDEIVQDDSKGYTYSYDAGFDVSGNDQKTTLINLIDGKAKPAQPYTLMGVSISSSFSDNLKRLGTPETLYTPTTDERTAVYLTKEDYLLILVAEKGADNVVGARLASYKDSGLEKNFDVSQFLNKAGATESNISSCFQISNKQKNTLGMNYLLSGGVEFQVDDQANIVKAITIDKQGIYNLFELRVGDSLDNAKKILGNPSNSLDLPASQTQYIFKHNNSEIHVNVDNKSKLITRIAAI